jgi:hypothetical protein
VTSVVFAHKHELYSVMVGVLRNYCNRERETSDLCSLMDEALSGAPQLRTRTPGGSPRPKKLSSSIVSKLVSDYSAGVPIHELAKKYGVHRATISGRWTEPE